MSDLPRRTRTVTLTVGGATFLLAVGLFLARVGRDALFIQDRGLWDLPRAYVGIALMAGPLAALVAVSLRFLGPRPARLVITALASVALLLFAAVVEPGGGALMTGFFAFVPLIWGILYSLTWLLAGELLDQQPPSELAWAYGLIASAAVLGGLVGGALAKMLARALPPAGLIALAAGAVVLAGVVLAVAQARWTPRMATPRSSGRGRRAAALSVLTTRHGGLMLATGMAAGLTGVLLEFQFYLSVARAGGSAQDGADRFATIYVALNGAALTAQVLLLPRLRRWVGVGGGLMVLPAVLTGGAGGMLAGFSIWGIGSLRVAEGGLKAALHRPNWERAYLWLSRAERTAARLIVDGVGMRMAQGLAAGLIYLWLRRYDTPADLVQGGTAQLLTPLLLASLTWLGLGILLRRCLDRHDTRADTFDVAPGMPLPDG